MSALDQSQLEISTQDVGFSSIRITWNQATVDVGQIFTLEISQLQRSVALNESYYYFTAPEGAPPCEV
jgi:hypothetical protein